MADASGVVNSILSGYRKLYELYRKQVTGNPDALNEAAKQRRLQTAAVRAVADAIVARSTTLAADWEATEQVRFNNDVTGLADKLALRAGQVLSETADRLTAAAAALTTACVGVDAEVTLFDARASLLVARARSVADGDVPKLIDAAKQVGVDSARVTQEIARDLSKALAMLFGLRPSPAFGPFGPDDPLVVAVIGNSYGMGEGVGEGTKDGKAMYYDARDRRHRSPYSAALQALELVHQQNRHVPIEAHLGGSSGAVTRDVVTDQTYEVRMNDGTTRQKVINEAQLFQIPKDAKVVIADFGGNDAMFGPIVEAAALSVRDRPAEFTTLLGKADEMLSDKDPTGRPYTEEDYRNQAASYEVGKAPTVVARWLQIIDEIRERAPHAKIVIPTYPDGVDPKALDSSMFFSATQGRDIERHLLRPLNSALEKVVELAGPGVVLADVSDTLRGHEAYTKEPWMNGLDPIFSMRDDQRYENTWAKQEPFHPNAEGYGAMSPRIAKEVADLAGLLPPPIPPDGTVTRPDHIRVIQGIPDIDRDGIANNIDPKPGNPQDQFRGRVTIPGR